MEKVTRICFCVLSILVTAPSPKLFMVSKPNAVITQALQENSIKSVLPQLIKLGDEPLGQN